MELKKIGVLSLAKIAGLFGLVCGLLLGIFSMIFSRVLLNRAPDVAQQFGVTQQVGVTALITSTIIYGIVYFIVGILTAFIYNLLAGWVGGVRIELKEAGKKK